MESCLSKWYNGENEIGGIGVHRIPQMKPGDTIGIFSSSRPITAEAPDATERAANFLRQRGYKVKFGSRSGKEECNYRSGTIQERVNEFNELIHDDSVTCLMASVGGYVSNAMLPYLDYDYLRTHPKLVIGHSDITSLLLGIYAQTDIPTCYGPNLVTSFSLPEQYATVALNALEGVVGKNPYRHTFPKTYSDDNVNWIISGAEPFNIEPKPNKYRTICSGSAEGRLIGGNLCTFNSVMGSPYMPEIREGDILFLEDIGGTPDFCERHFSTLAISGIFDRIGGLILGKHKNYDDIGTGHSEIDVLMEVLGGRRFPILADYDCGHTIPILALPIGLPVHLDADAQIITIL